MSEFLIFTTPSLALASFFITKIIEMIQIYLNAFGPGSSKKDVDELERLAGQLSLSETDDQVKGILWYCKACTTSQGGILG